MLIIMVMLIRCGMLENSLVMIDVLYIEVWMLRWFDDDVVVMDDNYGAFTYIWYDVNGFVSLLGDMAYA